MTIEERVQRLEDEAAIRSLVARFADAETRNDQGMVRLLWTPEAVFRIGEPANQVLNGVEEIMRFLAELRGSKDFFVQFIHSGIVEIDGERARAKWLVQEVAKGSGHYNNFGFFVDHLEKRNGRWLFRERSYQYIFLDSNSFTGNAVPLSSQLLEEELPQ